MTPPRGVQLADLPHENFRIHIGRLIDGTGAATTFRAVMDVANGTIKSVGPEEMLKIDVPVIDFSDHTVVPMLMDAHAHLALSGTVDAERRKLQLAYEHDLVHMQLMDNLLANWRYGICAVRDGGDAARMVHRIVKHDLPSDRPAIAVMTCAAWHAPGRYGAMIGTPPPAGRSLAQAARAWFSRTDHVKVIQSGINSIEHFAHQGQPQFDLASLVGLVNAAHRHHLRVMVHANGVAAVGIAVEARCDSIEHGYFMGDDNLKRMADFGIVWIPTIVPMAVLSSMPQLSDRQRSIATQTVAHQMEQVRRARHFGVRIGVGSDAGSIGVQHGLAVHQELALLVDAGMTPWQAVQCATGTNAQLLNQFQSGVIKKGYRADFLVIPNRPNGIDHPDERRPQFSGCCHGGKWYVCDDISRVPFFSNLAKQTDLG